jgi:hypothetical protein
LNDQRILKLQFEEIILNYELNLEKILNFLEDDKPKNLNQNYFNLELSRKNIGLWKKFSDKEAIDYIYKELNSYCTYQGEEGL